MKKFLVKSFFVLSLLLLPLSFVNAQAKVDIKGPIQIAGEPAFSTEYGGQSLSGLIGNIVTGILGFVGTIAFIFFLYGGFLWLSAGGNDEQVGTAKKYLLNSTIGIIVIVIAYAAAYYITELIYFAAA